MRLDRSRSRAAAVDMSQNTKQGGLADLRETHNTYAKHIYLSDEWLWVFITLFDSSMLEPPSRFPSLGSGSAHSLSCRFGRICI